MPSQPLDLALDHYTERQSLVGAIGEVAGQMWADVNPARIVDSWVEQIPELTAITAGAQLGAARRADDYTTAVLDAQDVDAGAVAQVDPRGFAGQASDARGLATLLANPVIVTLLSIQDGMDIARALGMGRANLDMLVRTQVADAGRLADQTALTARPRAAGYVRMAVGGSCARCLLLSGKEYRYNAGFQRHPRCDCIGIPKGDSRVPGIRSPEARYAEMSPAERTRAGFTRADQRALAEGADLGQVVNARRGLYTAGGRRFTHEGTTKRGVFGSVKQNRGRPRLSVDQIFQDAVDRGDAVRLLQRNGYLLQPVPAVVASRAVAATGPTGAAKRAAARARQAEIDRRGNLADLLAELDSLIARSADRAVFRQRLAHAAGDSVDPAVLAKLARPIESGNMTSLRAAMTRAGKAEGLTPIGRAGDTVRFDEQLHAPVGEVPAAGAQVAVVRRGTVLDLNGEQIQLAKADVSTVGAKPKPKRPPKKAGGTVAKPKPPTIAELRALAKANGIPVPSGLRKADIVAHIQSWERATGRRILPDGIASPAPRKAASAKARPATPLRLMTKREVGQLEARAEVSRLRVELANAPNPQRRQAIQARLVDAEARASASGGVYNWDSPWWDEPSGYVGVPTVAQVRDHIEAVVHADIPEPLRTEMIDELVRQAALVPRTAMHLHHVASLSKFDLQGSGEALAYYQLADREMFFHPRWLRDRLQMDADSSRALATGWWTPSDAATHVAGTLAHEFGHHVGERILKLGDYRQLTEFADVVDRALGAGGAIAREVRHTTDFRQVVDDYLKGPHRWRASTLVSTYGVESYHELMAEVWHEFSTARAPRPEMAAIGAAMQRLAEDIEVMLL